MKELWNENWQKEFEGIMQLGEENRHKEDSHGFRLKGIKI